MAGQVAVPARTHTLGKRVDVASEARSVLSRVHVTDPVGLFCRTPLTSSNDFSATKSRIIQLCLELTSTVQKVSDAARVTARGSPEPRPAAASARSQAPTAGASPSFL